MNDLSAMKYIYILSFKRQTGQILLERKLLYALMFIKQLPFDRICIIRDVKNLRKANFRAAILANMAAIKLKAPPPPPITNFAAPTRFFV